MDLSPRHLEHQVYVPTAITLNRLTPQPTRSPINSRISAYKSFKANEIQNAEIKARHSILQSRIDENGISHTKQCQENCCTCRNVGEDIKLQGDDAESVKNENPSKKFAAPKTQVSFNVAIGKGESNMRIRQVTRLANQICECIREIEETSLTKTATKEFITPHELQVKKKRFEDYLNSGRRRLFTLKKEINLLEGHVAQRKKDCKWLRLLSTASRTLHQLLLGLKNHSGNALGNSVGLFFFKELLRISQQLLSVAATVGIKIPRQDVFKQSDLNFPKVENTVTIKPIITNNESIDSSSDLLHSSLDDQCLALLHPNSIRGRIATLAKASLSNKEDGMSNSEIKVLAPLSQEWMSEEDESNQKKYPKSKTRKKLKRSGSQQRGSSHSRSNDLLQVVPKKMKNVSPTRISSSKTLESEFSEIDNHKDLLIQHTMEGNDKRINDNPGHQKHVSSETLMTEIHYLFERVCRINDDWEETRKMMLDLRSHEDTEDSQLAHQQILNNAKCVLKGIQVDSVQSTSLDIQNPNERVNRMVKQHAPKIECSKYPFIIKDTWTQDLFNTESNYLENNAVEKDIYIQKKNTGDQTENTLYLGLNTIQDQVRTEKEQFWAALVKRGIVDTDNPVPVETKSITDLLDNTTEKKIRQDVLEIQMKKIHINNPREDGKSYNNLPINTETLNKKVQTKPLKEIIKYLNEKEIQVGGTLEKSYSTSFATETELSNAYKNQIEHSETTSQFLQNSEKIISSNDNTYTATEDQVSDIISKHLQRNESNDESLSSNNSFFKSQESKSKECELSYDRCSQSNTSNESAI
ncbi:unnamed protein product [Meganyctiphanes norvegica]|uniref:Uncharacterized protein n=1 Tax=Meganyctiphanes norvegica TaxID=48144 RepID=A0AAV2SH24_MEGNR